MALTFDRGGRPDGAPGPGFPAPVPADPRQSGLTYEPFYGLKEKPFSLTSDSRFFYQSRSHAPAFDDLLNAIRRRESLNVLTGDIGTGKTTLCRAVLQSLDRKTFSAFVPDPFASREELLKILLADFGVASVDDVTSGRLRSATRTELSYLLSEFLGTLAPLQAFAVVFIDEAQNLSQQLLEEVRILSDADGALQVVLVGQLELRARLKLPEMRQLDQRVSVHCQLQPLDLAGVAGYISHRLHVAGGSSDRVRFTGEAVEAIYLLSGGVPRVINRLCDRALRYGYSKKESTIDADIVESANPTPALDVEAPDMAAPAVAPAPIPAAPPVAPTPPPMAAAPVVVPPPIAVHLPTPPPIPPPAAPVPAPAPAAPKPAPAASVAEPRRLIVPPPLPAPAHEPAAAASEPSDSTEAWLKEIDRQTGPPVDLDWRQRWAATNAVADRELERQSGVRFRVPSRGWIVAAGAVLALVLAGAVFGPDAVVQVRELTTPPATPAVPAAPVHAAPVMPHVNPPIDPIVAPDGVTAPGPIGR
jgi:type II secretory pathway predicted ATPase ExeA